MTRVSIAVVVALLLLPSAARAQGQDDDEEEESQADATDEDEPPKKKKKPKASEDDAEDPDAGAAKEKETVAADVDVSADGLIESGAPKGRMTLPGGKFMLSAIVETNLAKGSAGKPLSVAPDLWIGVADRLTFGIYHSGRATTGFLSGFGSGLCFRDGMSGLCKVGLGEVYSFVGSELRIGLTEGGFATALVLGGSARFFDPEKLFAGKAGFLARIHGRRVGIELSPMAIVGLNKREEVMGISLNQDFLVVPLTIFLRFAPRFSLALQAGITTTFKKAGDNYRVPAAAGISWWISPHFAFDAAFGLAAVADKDDMTKAFDQRSATVGLSYAL